MAADRNEGSQSKHKDFASWKPGSEAAEAKEVGGDGDFGVPVGAGPSADRDYVSGNTRASDPGAAKPRSGEDADGVRTSGAGWTAEAVGAGSEGDIDVDVLGFGSGGSGVAATGPGDPAGADDVKSTGHPSDAFAAKERPQPGRRPRGTQTSSDDRQDPTTDPDDLGADAATNSARGDDSFAGEISSGEASGDDEPIPPGVDPRDA